MHYLQTTPVLLAVLCVEFSIVLLIFLIWFLLDVYDCCCIKFYVFRFILSMQYCGDNLGLWLANEEGDSLRVFIVLTIY